MPLSFHNYDKTQLYRSFSQPQLASRRRERSDDMTFYEPDEFAA